MDETPKTWTALLAIVWLPLALLALLPVLLLLVGLYYARALLAAATTGLVALFHHRPAPKSSGLQPPHFTDAPLTTREQNKAEGRRPAP